MPSSAEHHSSLSLFLFCVCVAAIASNADVDFSNGSWTGSFKNQNRIQLQFMKNGSIFGESYSLTEFQGLSNQAAGNADAILLYVLRPDRFSKVANGK